MISIIVNLFFLYYIYFAISQPRLIALVTREPDPGQTRLFIILACILFLLIYDGIFFLIRYLIRKKNASKPKSITGTKNFFYARLETEKNITIKYNNYPIVYFGTIIFAMLGFIYFASNSSFIPGWMLALSGLSFVSFTIIRLVVGLNVEREISRAIKQGYAEVTGSKLSLSKPFTVIIPKQNS